MSNPPASAPLLFLIAAIMALSSSAGANRLPKAPKKTALSKSALIRPLQRAFGNIKYEKTKGASRLSLYRFNKASKSLELRLTLFKEKRSDGSTIESLRLRVPSAKRMSTKEFHRGKLSLGKIADLFLRSDVHYSLLTQADGTSTKFFRGQLSNEVYTSNTQYLDGKKLTTNYFTPILSTQQHTKKKLLTTSHYELVHLAKSFNLNMTNHSN